MLIGAVVFFLFQKQILSTILYVVTVNQVVDQEQGYIIPQPYQLQPSSDVVAQSVVTVAAIAVPLIFIEESNDVFELGYAGRGGGKSVLIIQNSDTFMDGTLVSMQGVDRKEMCDALSRAAGTSACDSEYHFLRAVFNTSPDTTRWYSSAQQKTGFGTLSILKATLGSAEKEFTTTEVRGFVTTNQDSVQVDLFTYQNDTHYQLVFTGHTQEEIDYTLQNIEVLE